MTKNEFKTFIEKIIKSLEKGCEVYILPQIHHEFEKVMDQVEDDDRFSSYDKECIEFLSNVTLITYAVAEPKMLSTFKKIHTYIC